MGFQLQAAGRKRFQSFMTIVTDAPRLQAGAATLASQTRSLTNCERNGCHGAIFKGTLISRQDHENLDPSRLSDGVGGIIAVRRRRRLPLAPARGPCAHAGLAGAPAQSRGLHGVGVGCVLARLRTTMRMALSGLPRGRWAGRLHRANRRLRPRLSKRVPNIRRPAAQLSQLAVTLP